VLAKSIGTTTIRGYAVQKQPTNQTERGYAAQVLATPHGNPKEDRSEPQLVKSPSISILFLFFVVTLFDRLLTKTSPAVTLPGF
jgi:hypothetical protein